MSDNLPPSQKFDFYADGLASGSDSIYTPFLGLPNRPDKGYAYAQRSNSKYNM
jgi:hypothetical protein